MQASGLQNFLRFAKVWGNIARCWECPQAVRSAGLGRLFWHISVVAHSVGVRAELPSCAFGTICGSSVAKMSKKNYGFFPGFLQVIHYNNLEYNNIHQKVGVAK